MKKMVRLLLALIITCCIANGMTLVSAASSPGNVVGYTMETEKAVDAYAEKDTSSSIVHHYNSGDYLFVLGQQGDWIEVFYQGKIAYIPLQATGPGSSKAADDSKTEGSGSAAESSKEAVSDDEKIETDKIKSDFLTGVEVEGLEEELAANDEEAKKQDEIMEQQHQREQRAKIWRIGIVIIIILIVAVGTVPMILKKKRR